MLDQTVANCKDMSFDGRDFVEIGSHDLEVMCTQEEGEPLRQQIRLIRHLSDMVKPARAVERQVAPQGGARLSSSLQDKVRAATVAGNFAEVARLGRAMAVAGIKDPLSETKALILEATGGWGHG